VRPRRGALGQVTGTAEDVLAAMRRRQRDREPRVLLFDARGEPTRVRPDAPGREELVEAAERLVTATRPGPEK
jgi:hypothetical protein